MIPHGIVKQLTVTGLTIVLLIAAAGSAMAFGHYTPGALALNAATLPPPGLHYTMYNIYYTADAMKDDRGNDLDLGLDLSVYAMANQFTYMTKHKILGADYGACMIIPLVSTDIKISAAGVNEDSFEVGDLYFEPFILGWHGPQWDLTFAVGFYAPTASSDEPSSAGKGYWSIMETLGGTYYFDKNRTWSVSMLTRWLQNTEDDDTNITPGADMVAEYGVAKAFPNQNKSVFTAGLAGYSYAQLTEDSGDGASNDTYRGHAVGPEVRYMVFNPFPIQISFRYLFEYGVENSSEGSNLCLTLIGSF